MGERSLISWCDATLNFWVGCTKVSTGPKGACENCYAETWAKRWPAYRDTWGSGAPRVQFKHLLAKARKLEKLALEKKHQGRGAFFCFSNSLSDIFDKEVPIAWLAEAFSVMRATPHVTYLLLTKRPQNIVGRAMAAGGLPPNAAIGCTVVTQKEAEHNLPWLLQAKLLLRPAFAFVSIEPMREHIRLLGRFIKRAWTAGVDWVICGFESGPHAAPGHPAWARSLRDQCAAARVPFEFKQWGEWREAQPGDEFDTSRGRAGKPPAFIVKPSDGSVHCFLPDDDAGCLAMLRVGKDAAGRLLDGALHDARPEVVACV